MIEIAVNRKAFHLYDILERIEAGLVLTGDEIKAIRAHKVSLVGSYARILGNDPQELFWVGGTISTASGEATRSRKLLVHRAELERLIGKLTEKGLTLVPLRLYLKHGRAKLELGLGRGRKLHDKRALIREREAQRKIEQAERRLVDSHRD